jgi:hypothetical protein
MELENLRKQEPNSGDPFGGNRMFRIAIIVLGILAVVGVLIFLFIVLGFLGANRQVANNPTPAAATAVVIVETQAPPTAPEQPTAAPPTPTLVLNASTPSATTAANAQPTVILATPTAAVPQPTSASNSNAQPTQAGAASGSTRLPTAAGGGANQGPLAGLFVAALRYDPPRPVRNDPVNFYATFVNRTGKDQNYPVCAEVYLPDHKNPLGTTDCNLTTIVPGTAEVPVGFWIGTGIKQCIALRARVVMREKGGEERIPFTTVNGGELWTDFSVCP